jgi:hypothetical protein
MLPPVLAQSTVVFFVPVTVALKRIPEPGCTTGLAGETTTVTGGVVGVPAYTVTWPGADTVA